MNVIMAGIWVPGSIEWCWGRRRDVDGNIGGEDL